MPVIRKFDRRWDGERIQGAAGLLGLAALSYVYFLLLVGLLATVCGVLILLVMVAGKSGNPAFAGALGAAVLALGYACCRSIWLRLPVPSGLLLNADEAAPLRGEIERLRRIIGAGHVRGIVVDDEFRVAIVPAGQIGPLGAHENYLVVGLPMMQALSPEMFTAALIRELSHLSRSKGLAGSIHDLHRTWLRLHELIRSHDDFGSFIARAFAGRYVWLLERWAPTVTRKHELKADLVAAEVTGAENVAQLLLGLVVGGAFLREEVWPGIYRRADENLDPPETPYDDVESALRFGPSPERAKEWIDEALSETAANEAGYGLAERLALLGHTSSATQPPAAGAAEYLLGASYPFVKAQLGQAWREEIRDSWRVWHGHIRQTRERFHDVPPVFGQHMTPAEAWQHACLVEEFQGAQVALPLYRDFAAKHPNHAAAQFALGRVLLSQQQTEGIGLLLRAMNLDRDYALRSSELIYRFLRSWRPKLEDFDNELLPVAVAAAAAPRTGQGIDWNRLQLNLELAYTGDRPGALVADLPEVRYLSNRSPR